MFKYYFKLPLFSTCKLLLSGLSYIVINYHTLTNYFAIDIE